MGQRVTIVDVARAAGVSISSASVALNDRDGVSADTRTRVRRVADELGWVPSASGRSLVSRRSRAVGLVIQRPIAVLEADPFFPGFVGGVETALDELGYRLVLQTARTAQAAVERIRTMSLAGVVDGVLLTDVRTRDPRRALVAALDLPAVAINARLPGLVSVYQDHTEALRALVDLVIGHGHTHIAHVGGAPGFVHSTQRTSVWRGALTEAGLIPGPLLRGDFTSEGGAKAADVLLRERNRPTAVVCANDLTAIGFVSRATELGMRVPADISVTGFDGIALGSYITPPLTTAETSPHALGVTAATALLAVLDGQPPPATHIEPARMIVRRSVATRPDRV